MTTNFICSHFHWSPINPANKDFSKPSLKAQLSPFLPSDGEAPFLTVRRDYLPAGSTNCVVAQQLLCFLLPFVSPSLLLPKAEISLSWLPPVVSLVSLIAAASDSDCAGDIPGLACPWFVVAAALGFFSQPPPFSLNPPLFGGPHTDNRKASLSQTISAAVIAPV